MDVTSYGKPFPCKMIIYNNHMPPAFLKNFKNYIPFSLNLAEAVKRQIIFARAVASIYPHDPVPGSLHVDSQQRYAKFMNLIQINGTEALVPALGIDLF